MKQYLEQKREASNRILTSSSLLSGNIGVAATASQRRHLQMSQPEDLHRQAGLEVLSKGYRLMPLQYLPLPSSQPSPQL
jgi:hypothetical protein